MAFWVLFWRPDESSIYSDVHMIEMLNKKVERLEVKCGGRYPFPNWLSKLMVKEGVEKFQV